MLPFWKQREKPLLLSFYCLCLIYQMHALKTKKINSLGWHKSYTVYIIATVTQRNVNFIVAQTYFAPKINCSTYLKVQAQHKTF